MQLPTNTNRAKQVGMVLDVLDNADIPVSPVKPNRYLIALTGSVFGIFLAAVISLIRRRWKPEAGFPHRHRAGVKLMNRLAHWMMRLYPSRWRKRYGDELDALLAETGADRRIVANLAAGGIRMQCSTWSFPKLAIVLGIAGVLLGGLGSFLIAPTYISGSDSARIDPMLEHRLEPLSA